MSNIIDYMKWRGDLTFAQDSFNEIDNLILSQLVYVELNNIVPGDEEPTISLLDAAKLFFKQKTAYEIGCCDWSSDVCSSDLVGSSSPGTILFSST